MFYYLIALAVILIDQVTKWMIVKEMYYGQSITVIENFLYITSHRNRGAAWGILQGQMWFFYLITVVVVVGLIIYIQKLKKQDKWFGIALALMLGGAIGNFIDRVVRKEVVDFVNTYIFTYDFPIFNVADSALVVGVIIMFIMTLFEGKMKKEHKE
ncbi:MULTISPECIES: signal peptidase II [Priestia]|uniref:Lipoprotein signal peptidase n=7 Tax=Bacteria TaxID=2 RepID=A0A109G857_PRIMG|nr:MULTISPECIES: signal peptidase II [Priestia]KOP76245.1 peptidase A8 [Bacillus sp. FJAT-21351]KQU11226.1 signal peptidase II [Bacillus sp. Leaf75]KRD89637.1 signal peptidase II [Bacillus sp. Root147]KRE05523.1 signal peptidase II [Bacillus sp. Root239]KRF57547.1 signal peptidase II [Bacillus sp. Soil531]MBK0008159.1 signal peptidase II [Bacillus sp. S35]MBK0293257.1 signal peptidase II [Bacillus sp. S34]MBU8850983.1 signal peptidase II [Bacillus sp. FJAT-26377]MCF6798139.1 signal peptida